MARKIIDIHQHLEAAADTDQMAEEYGRLGVVKAVLLGLPPKRLPGNNDLLLAAAKQYPKLFVPFAGFDLDAMTAADVTRFRDAGFKGIKFIGVRRPYNDPAYFPVYEQACALRLPVLFHLGIVANTGAWSDCDSGLMRPIHLDHIARRLPSLTLIGAHFGNPWSDEAAMACRWNPNLFFDMSGSLLKYRSPAYLGSLLWWTDDGPYKSPDRTHAWQKILFGSDVATRQIADVIHDYELLMDGLNLPAALREAVWYGTAARLLGVT